MLLPRLVSFELIGWLAMEVKCVLSFGCVCSVLFRGTNVTINAGEPRTSVPAVGSPSLSHLHRVEVECVHTTKMSVVFPQGKTIERSFT